MSRALRRVVVLLLVAFPPLAIGCTGAYRPRPESAARLKDGAPEKLAAQRAAGRGLDLEREDERWGFEAARERRRAEAQKRQKATAATPTLGPPYILQTPRQ